MLTSQLLDAALPSLVRTLRPRPEPPVLQARNRVRTSWRRSLGRRSGSPARSIPPPDGDTGGAHHHLTSLWNRARLGEQRPVADDGAAGARDGGGSPGFGLADADPRRRGLHPPGMSDDDGADDGGLGQRSAAACRPSFAKSQGARDHHRSGERSRVPRQGDHPPDHPTPHQRGAVLLRAGAAETARSRAASPCGSPSRRRAW